jgi:glycosyltransferase involved in cell wall biosynthesis
MRNSSYVLITPARDEEGYIERVIKSVVSQTVLPRKWIIVSDNSADRTDQIVSNYTTKHDFISLLRVSGDGDRNFGSKVKAFRWGYEKLKGVAYNFIGNLDADISFGRDYYERVLKRFAQNPRLGIAGGVILDVYDGKVRSEQDNINSVGCAVQMFRAQCFNEIGGYIPLEVGGEDAAAEVMARMNGWEVTSFPDIRVFHHRQTGTRDRSIYHARMLNGIEDYQLGYHPLFHMAKSLYRLKEKPFLVGSILRLYGYYRAMLRNDRRMVSKEFVQYLRHEQIRQLRSRIMKRPGSSQYDS